MVGDVRDRPAVRWRAARWLLVLWVVGLGVVELEPHAYAQHKWTHQFMLGFLMSVLLVAWFLFWSRFAPRVRWLGLGVLVGMLGLVGGCFRYVGMSGDLRPQFAWRWGPAPATNAPTAATRSALPAVPMGVIDFSQFLGPNRNGHVAGPHLEQNWRAHPPQVLWRQPVGEGWGGFATSGGVAVTQEQRGDQELVIAYDLMTGQVLWSDAEATRFANEVGGNGPRATPTIVDGKVYTMGANGHLHVLELATGQRLWSKNVVESNGAGVPAWGVSASPLVLGDAVIVVPGQATGGTLAAYHRGDGTRLWISGNQPASYSSPRLVTVQGLPQLLYFGAEKLAGLDPANGKLLWETPWSPNPKWPHVAMPVQLGDGKFLISSGYGKGCAQISLAHPNATEWTATADWQMLKFQAKFSNPIAHGGYVYGLDDGVLACINPAEEGQRMWKAGKYGHGQMLLVADELFLITAEDGSIVLVEPDPAELKQVATFPLFTDKTWNPPALAGPYLLVRNDREAACLRLPVR